MSGWIKQNSDGDEIKELMYWQIIASAVNSNVVQPFMFFLVDDGQGRTGKSTFEQFLMALVGNGNYESLKLTEFENDFKVANAIGAALIIGDDNHPGEFNEKSDTLKSMVTGDIVLINPKGLPPYTAQSTALIVQSMNDLPRFQDTSGGLARRVKVVKFNHQYDDSPAGRKIKDVYIKDKRLLEFALKQALSVDITSLADTEESRLEVERLKEEGNPVAYFVANYWDNFKSNKIPVNVGFKYFLKIMESENRKSRMSQTKFTREMKRILKGRGWEYKQATNISKTDFNEDDKELVWNFAIDPKKKYNAFVRM